MRMMLVGKDVHVAPLGHDLATRRPCERLRRCVGMNVLQETRSVARHDLVFG